MARPLILEYYLLVSPLAKDLEIYGVKIVEQRSGAAASALDLTVSSRLIFHLIYLLSKGIVTPISLADIVEDWLSCGRSSGLPASLLLLQPLQQRAIFTLTFLRAERLFCIGRNFPRLAHRNSAVHSAIRTIIPHTSLGNSPFFRHFPNRKKMYITTPFLFGILLYRQFYNHFITLLLPVTHSLQPAAIKAQRTN